jgi:phosphoglycolate phosphatase
MLAQLGGAALAPQQVRGLIGDGIEALVTRSLAQSLGAERAQAIPLGQAVGLFREHYRRHLFEASHVYPGVFEALRSLKDRLHLACVTNKEADLAQPLLEQAGLAPWLEFCLSPEQRSQRKPSPDLLLAAAGRAGIAIGELLHVGDSRTDILAARAAGCRVVATRMGYSAAAALAALAPDGLIGPLTELAAL